MTTKWDVAIVGAGPAGAATATLLARAGRKVVLVDAAHFPRQKVCGEYLSAAAWRILERLRLGVARDSAVALDTMTLAVPSGRQVCVAYDAEPAQRPAALGRDVLDAALVVCARSAGVEVLEGFRARSLLRADGRASGIEVVDVARPDERRELLAPLVVAADGRRSRLVREAGRVAARRSSLAGFKRHLRVGDFAAWSGRIAMFAAQGGYVGVCPVAPGRLNLCGTVPTSYLQAAHGRMGDALRAFLGRASHLAPLLNDSEDPAEAWHTMPEVALQRATHMLPGVLFVGDAMGTIEPLTGQGMTMALAGAELVAEIAAERGSQVVDGATQRRYERAWRRKFGRQIFAAQQFGRLLRRPALLEAAMIGAGCVPRFAQMLFRGAHRRTLTAT